MKISPDTHDAAIALADVSVRRGGRVVLAGVNVTAHAGQVTALVGPNGAGKSTLLRAIAGVLPFTGDIRIAGRKVTALSPRERACLFTLVPQQSALEAALSVEEVVAQGRFPHRSLFGALGGRDEEAITQAMRQSDVEGLRHRPFNQLSHGERRRVILARALATRAEVVLLDEPSAALDVRHVLSLFRLLRDLAAEGKCVLVVLHQLQEVAQVADRVVLLDAGVVRCQGAVGEVITPAIIESVYGVRLLPAGGFSYTQVEP